MTADYKSTVFLPQTDFPMRGDLPKREPLLLERWQKTHLYETQRRSSKGREKFVLHDGPPYANGHLHMGHALNKILKDVISRSQQMMGRDSTYVPGWDCHGLPIEWKIEEKYRAAKKSKDDVPIVEFRKECREFAQHWIDVQREEFKRLGVIGDWDNPYTTMTNAAEAQISREIGKFLLNGGLFRGAKPVLWSVVEQTALADAEVEYHDHTSTTVWVKFPIVKPPRPELAGAFLVIWTTTPWTLPGNRAIAYGPAFDYVLVKVGEERLVMAEALVGEVMKASGHEHYEVLERIKGDDLAGTVAAHPLRGKGYEFDVPALPGDFVTTETGTGLVHINPGAGLDDYELGLAHRLDVPNTVGPDGAYYAHVPLFAGKTVYRSNGKPGDANEAVIAAMREVGAILAQGKLAHSYPHSWRSKAPLIFRNTPQWFIGMERNELRKKALAAIDATRFVPPQGQNRLRSMIENRPDWCISRQRAWGVPIAIFVRKADGEPLRDERVVERIAGIFEKEGSDAWFSRPPQDFLGNEYKADEYEQVRDIVEVWFESGSTHSFVLEQRPDLQWPASLYLEGSDQHRGWFHSSLLESCGTRGRAPYDAVLTHGFVLDEQGRAMSKSLGNGVAPQDVMRQYGADILRLWVVASDYSEDLRIGPEILKHHAEMYRRIRNTLRYLLGGLSGYEAAEAVAPSAMPELERWVLHRLAELDRLVRRSTDEFDFHTMFTALHNFCAVDLSAFWFDVRKDALYCDSPSSPVRRAVRTVMDRTFDCLAKWLAPMLAFTAEEAWIARHGDGSVHLETYPEVPAEWHDESLGTKWARLRELRRVVTGALELERAQKRIGSSLQADAQLYLREEDRAFLEGVDLAEICITSSGAVRTDPAPEGAFTLADVPGVAAVIGLAAGEKCARCWKVLTEVGSVAAHAELCGRCAGAVEAAVAHA